MENQRSYWTRELMNVKQCCQRQDSLQDQLEDLRTIANRFGFYDASDFIRNVLEKDSINR